MKVIPAIDLLDGRAVRLRRGRREDATVYHDAPWELVREMASAGAERIHVVDLEGALSGDRAHRRAVERILELSPVPVEVGGGLRDRRSVKAALGAGASYAVLGTIAVQAPTLAEELCRAYPGRIIIAVDARDGRVAVKGWTEEAEVEATELGRRAASWGAAALLYTDVSRDGTGEGPNVQATRALQDAVGPGTPVIASGGIGSLDHLRALAAAGISMTILGRALYDGVFTLEEAIAAARAEPSATC